MNSKIVAHTSEEIDLHNIIIYKKKYKQGKENKPGEFWAEIF